MSKDDAPIAYLNWSVDVECPKCQEINDLDDCEGFVSGKIFNNLWGDLQGFRVVCSKCNHAFNISHVEH